ncbi:hypothetical protein JCM10449v2_002405 [Rhodotorula kratochvilovae]
MSPTSAPDSVSPSAAPSPLANVRAVLFDQFGTLTNWEASISRLLSEEAQGEVAGGGGGEAEVDWLAFTRRWREGYMTRTREIAMGKPGPGNIDELHLEARRIPLFAPIPYADRFCSTRQILNTLLDEGDYAALAKAWSAERRKELCQLWHRLDAWADTKPGLDALRSLDPPVFLATLSNGTLRLLIDVARHNALPLDAHFSGDVLKSYKPHPAMYLGACGLLGFDEAARSRGEVALCASHIDDLRAASTHGIRTIYIRRATEDVGIPHGGDAVKPKSEGGEVDAVIWDIGEIARLVRP